MAKLMMGCLTLVGLILAAPAFAQSVEVDDGGETNAQVQEAPQAAAPQTGTDSVKQYFQKRRPKSGRRPQDSAAADGATPRYLALHVGTFLADQSYNWGNRDEKKNLHNFNAGVTYRLGEWVNSMDFAIRIEYTGYSLGDSAAKKISIDPMLTFPDANSRFPLYFGGGLGLGLFVQQVHDRSPVALDWQLIVGARFQNVFDKVGLMFESGIKNHVMLLSPGQYNGVFFSVGTVFAF